MTDCVFCEILAGELPSSVVYQDERCTAIMDIQPKAQPSVFRAAGTCGVGLGSGADQECSVGRKAI